MPITVVQTTTTGTFGVNTTAGNTLVYTGSQSASLPTIGGSADNFIDEIDSATFGGSNVSLFVDFNCAGGQTAAALGGGTLQCAYEIAGVASVDQVASSGNATAGTTFTISDGTTTVASEIWIVCTRSLQNANTVAGWTRDDTGTSFHKIVSATGVAAISGTWPNAAIYAIAIITLAAPPTPLSNPLVFKRQAVKRAAHY